MEHTIIYIESHIVCIMFLLVLFILSLKHWRPRYLNPLSAIYLITMFTSMLDIAWILVDGTSRLRWLSHIVNIMYLSSYEFIGFFWLDHCAEAFPFRLWKNRWQRFCFMLPAVVISLLIALSAFTGWIYGIDEAGVYYRGPVFFIQPLAYGYLLLSTGLSVKARKMARFRDEKKNFAAMALFPLPSLFLGILQVLTPPGSLPIMQVSIALALLIETIVKLESSVTQDSLTGLCNRYALDRALNAKISAVRRGRSGELYVMMGDLDRFKSINDTYGHLEGDRALKLTANALKNIFHGSSAVLSRIGGDEFVIIMEDASDEEMHATMHRIGDALCKIAADKPYNLAMSLGMARYSGQETATEFLKDADHALYHSKRTRACR